jgi:Arc/MetJ family transcription regulator
MVEAWLRRPLEVPTTQELLALVMQAYSLMEKSNIFTDTSQTHLEELLDNRDSEAVASVVTLSLVQVFKTDAVPGVESFGLSLLKLLADHGNIAMDQMSSIIQNIYPRVATPNTSLSGIAATLHTGLRNLFIRTMIKSHSIGQRGRYRWSTVYIEEMILLCQRLTTPGSTLSEIRMIIKEAECRTTAAAIDALKGQIRKMKSAGKEDLVQDLFRAGIRAEMMSSPTIFLKPNFAQLVTYGFALVQRDENTIRYTFSEPIAVRAVMEYLPTEGGNEYQDLMLQWLVHTQDDYEVRAMFGKATEWFVAMVRHPQHTIHMGQKLKHYFAVVRSFTQT